MKKTDIKNYCVSPDAAVRNVIEVIDKNKDCIALVVDKRGKLIGTVTDGDIRRFMLKNGSFDSPCSIIMARNPVTASADSSAKILHSLMKKHRLINLPLIDKKGYPRQVITLRDLVATEKSRVAVIMAGGEGKRLRPLTENIPKPMIQIGDCPLLKRIILNLAETGITKVFISVNYHAKVIQDYFQNGEEYGIEISYLHETKKLGTAGALSLLPEMPSDPILVMNGDVVTNINFERLFDFHCHHRCVMSIAAMEYHINIPYGVMNLASHYVMGIEEKPSQSFFCNAGIYIIDPELLRFVPMDSYYDMTNLLQDVLKDGLPVTAFPIHEYWIDVGQEKDLHKARKDLKS